MSREVDAVFVSLILRSAETPRSDAFETFEVLVDWVLERGLVKLPEKFIGMPYYALRRAVHDWARRQLRPVLLDKEGSGTVEVTSVENIRDRRGMPCLVVHFRRVGEPRVYVWWWRLPGRAAPALDGLSREGPGFYELTIRRIETKKRVPFFHYVWTGPMPR